MDILTKVLLGLLTLDTIRAVIAMLGWVKPESKIAWIIYGRYDRNLIISALQDMGYTHEKREKIIRGMKKIAADARRQTGIVEHDVDVQLIILLAKYIEKFPDGIRFSEGSVSESHYYVDTMEISHDEKDLKIMHAIMLQLIRKNRTLKKIPSVIISPKTGNPVFAQTLARTLSSQLLIAKSENDPSRVSSYGSNATELFKVNYEGSWNILQSSNIFDCIVLDCNTTTGGQLIEIIDEINEMIQEQGNAIRLKKPQQAFVLFCADKQKEDIDTKFSSRGIKLYRFFDLDENTKEMLYALKTRCAVENRAPNYFIDKDKEEAIDILKKLKAENNYHY